MNLPVPYILAFITAAMVVITLWRLWAVRTKTKLQWIGFVLGNALCFAFLYLAGPWAYLSYYFRWLALIAYVFIMFFGIQRLQQLPWNAGGRFFFWVGRVISIVVFGFLIGQFIKGTYATNKIVANIDFPLKNGRFYIMQGGNSIATNPFHRGFDRYSHTLDNEFALDIAKLNKWGNRAKGVYPAALRKYEIYEDTVYAPAPGIILTAISNVPSNKIGYLNRSEVPGNHVIIKTDKGYLLQLLHFQQNKVFVETGDTVKLGDPLGLVGNSGFSSEPHLHINALVSDSIENFYHGTSIPIYFNGTFHFINDIIRR